MAKDAPGMKGYRPRNESGQLREKRGDTHMGTIEEKYQRDFNVRSDMHLDTYLQSKRINSLNDLMHRQCLSAHYNTSIDKTVRAFYTHSKFKSIVNYQSHP